MGAWFLALLLAWGAGVPVPARAAGPIPPKGSTEKVSAAGSPASKAPKARPELSLEWDAYYTDLGLFLPLTGKPIPTVGEVDEFTVYRNMFFNSLRPRFLVLEAAVFPMPVLGVYLKKNHPDFYGDFGTGRDFNLIESVTAGFPEPYAFSLFLGDVVEFAKPGEEHRAINKGYMGYLFSYAVDHIKNNQLIGDHSYEVEWKLKGDRLFDDDKLSWSFRLGTKIHENPDITNAAYLGIRRSNLDFAAGFFSWLANSSIDFRWDFSLKDGDLLRQEYVLGKTYPLHHPHVALKLDLGFIWESNRQYTGALSDRDFHNYTLVFRPNLEF